MLLRFMFIVCVRSWKVVLCVLLFFVVLVICWRCRVIDVGSLCGRLLLWLVLFLLLVFLVSGLSVYWNGCEVVDIVYDWILLVLVWVIVDGFYEKDGILCVDVFYVVLDIFVYDSVGWIFY